MRPCVQPLTSRAASLKGTRLSQASTRAHAPSRARATSTTVSELGLFDFIGGDLIRPNIGTFMEDLEENLALAVYAPLEGGFEGRFVTSVSRAGYQILNLNARGLGDVEAYLTKVHGTRPPHLGRQPIQRFYEPGLANTILEAKGPGKEKGVCIWIGDGQVLSKLELSYLSSLTVENPNFKVVVERGPAREFKWKPLLEVSQKAGNQSF